MSQDIPTNTKAAKPVQPTFAMRCPHCEKTTRCKEFKIPVQAMTDAKKAGNHRYICTECNGGWGVQTGGGFSL